MHPSLSSKEIQKARRIAKRTRAAVACARCKSAKSKCNDFRPCKPCADAFVSCENIQKTKKDIDRTSIMSADDSLHLSPTTAELAICRITADSVMLGNTSVRDAGLHDFDITVNSGFSAGTSRLASMPTIPHFSNLHSNSFNSTQIAFSHLSSSLPLFESFLPTAPFVFPSIFRANAPPYAMHLDPRMMLRLPPNFAPLFP